MCLYGAVEEVVPEICVRFAYTCPCVWRVCPVAVLPMRGSPGLHTARVRCPAPHCIVDWKFCFIFKFPYDCCTLMLRFLLIRRRTRWATHGRHLPTWKTPPLNGTAAVTYAPAGPVWKFLLRAARDTLGPWSVVPLDCTPARSASQYISTPSGDTASGTLTQRLHRHCERVVIAVAHLFVVRFRANVDQVRRDTGQTALAVRAAGAFLRLREIFVQFVHGALESVSIDLQGKASAPNEPCWEVQVSTTLQPVLPYSPTPGGNGSGTWPTCLRCNPAGWILSCSLAGWWPVCPAGTFVHWP